jgi:2-C-methyl-D-erythritol 4-phosphate cytidylyltransferase
VVPAAGRGERLGAPGPKAFADLAGRPLVAYGLAAAAASGAVEAAVVVADLGPAEAALARLGADLRRLVRAVVPGGATRRESVRAGLAAVRQAVGAAADPVVLVHDAARPLAPPALFARVAEAVGAGAAAVLCARPSPDTVKQIAGDLVTATLPRDVLALAQTPQGARLSLLERAHREWPSGDAGDDALLVEALGETVRVVAGTPFNFKITSAEDLALAEAWVRSGGTPWMGPPA